jgi:hypothetical protein
MRRATKVASLLVLGIVIGAGGSETLHVIRDRYRTEFLEQRLRCKGLADAYVAKNSDEMTSIFLDRSDFSTRRNSCVAAVTRVSLQTTHYEVVDILTSETLFFGKCSDREDSKSFWCGNGRNDKLMDERDKEFVEVVK